ncbi:MAG: hypothetical protein CM1200mP6_06590 [Anaerolineaceae bacterium]|nr:MAG: hypothetical protein CM1200mP6_06590 [Anaerolineaceae bacterium]
MVNLRVNDVRAVHNSLEERGIEFMRPPEQEHWGGWICTFSVSRWKHHSACAR